MRADEAITSSELCDMNNDGLTLNYINQLRYERLMAKAETIRQYGNRKWYEFKNKGAGEFLRYCLDLADKIEARAKRIKEDM